jgi:hypothetical protein
VPGHAFSDAETHALCQSASALASSIAALFANQCNSIGGLRAQCEFEPPIRYMTPPTSFRNCSQHTSLLRCSNAKYLTILVLKCNFATCHCVLGNSGGSCAAPAANQEWAIIVTRKSPQDVSPAAILCYTDKRDLQRMAGSPPR